jgi:hypothetical protein
MAESFTVGSPMDTGLGLDDDEDEDKRSNFGSLMSPVSFDDRSLAAQEIFQQQNMHVQKSLLGNALSDISKPLSYPQAHYSASVPVSSPLATSFQSMNFNNLPMSSSQASQLNLAQSYHMSGSYDRSIYDTRFSRLGHFDDAINHLDEHRQQYMQ